MKCLQLTAKSGDGEWKEVFINLDLVTVIDQNEDETRVYFTAGNEDFIIVRESAAQIIRYC